MDRRDPEGQISTAPGSCGDIEFYAMEVKFDALFSLPPEDVDKLRQVAGRLLNDSSEFKRLLRDLQ